MLIPVILALVYPACLVWAAVSDIRSMTISNRLTGFLAVAFLPVALACHMTFSQMGLHLALGCAGLVLGIVFFAFRLMGGGDAKLIAAASLWLGVHGCVDMLLYTALAGGALTLGLMGARQPIFAGYATVLPGWATRHLEPKGDIPYGVAICVGGLMAIGQSDLLPLLGF